MDVKQKPKKLLTLISYMAYLMDCRNFLQCIIGTVYVDNMHIVRTGELFFFKVKYNIYLMCFIAIVKPFSMLRLPDQDYGLTAGVTGQQGMLTPPRHLIPPLVCPGSVFAQLLFLYYVWDLRD